MFKRLFIRLFFTGLTIFSITLPSVSQTIRDSTELTIDQIAEHFEQKYHVHFFYKPEWFEKIKFNSSVFALSFEQALNKLSSETDLSIFTIDSALYIFIPVKPELRPSSAMESADEQIIGNPDDYGKFSKAIIKGKISDGSSGNPLPGASIHIDQIKLGATADKNGNYTLQVPVGEYTIRLSFIGYDDNRQKIKLVSDGTLNMNLFEKSIHLGEVVVSSQRPESNFTGTLMSIVKLDVRAIKELPVSIGGRDIIKSITLMPGIQTIGEFGTGFNVRGGSADQNLILLQDVPIFNLSHVFGLISAVNSDGISNVTLLKAGISAKYGERASSVMDIQMGANNPDKTTVKGSIGIINSSLYLETPLIDKKINLLVSARSSYSNWLLHSIPDIDLMNSSAHFSDIDALLSFNVNARNKIDIFSYLSNDRFGFARTTDNKYNNIIGSVRWKHSFNNHLFLNLTAGLSNYRFEISESDTSKLWEAYRINSELYYKSTKLNISWLPNEYNSIDFGINAVLYNIKPGKLTGLSDSSVVIPVQMLPEKALENAIYITDNITISPKLAFDVGIRYSLYSYLGPNKIYIYQSGLPRTPGSVIDSLTYGKNQSICWYSGLEPRVSLRFTISENSSVKLSYNRIHQYVNLVSNTAIMAPTDVWKLSSPNLKPLTCDHFALGYFKNFKNNSYETSVEVYYKSLLNSIEYKNGASILLNPYLESALTNVKGYNYGLELYVKKNTGKLTGWLSYTFSRALQKTNGIFPDDRINNNQLFPSNFDRPNNLILNANYHISKRWRFNGTFTYSTGRPVTLPEYKFSYQDYQLVYYSDRNKYRLPDYHRLDISITLDESIRIRKKWKGSWTFSIINLYGRKNAYSVFYKEEKHIVASEYRLYDTYMLYIIGRPLPMFTYNFTF